MANIRFIVGLFGKNVQILITVWNVTRQIKSDWLKNLFLFFLINYQGCNTVRTMLVQKKKNWIVLMNVVYLWKALTKGQLRALYLVVPFIYDQWRIVHDHVYLLTGRSSIWWKYSRTLCHIMVGRDEQHWYGNKRQWWQQLLFPSTVSCKW